MKADTNDLSTVFGKDIRYVVPLYQRPYVWNKVEHWEPLWDDVRWVLERSAETAATEKPAPHFLGAVVLEQLRTQLGEIDSRVVIDGQQRLTTLQLLIDAASRVAVEAGCEIEGRLLASLTRNNPDLVKSRPEGFKVWPTNANREAFVDVMAGEAAHDDASNRIHEAHTFFLDTLRAWSFESEDPKASFEALAAVLRNLLKLVVIDLDEEDDAQVIFESLNARGTPLLAIDLVKNLVFQRAERAPEEIDLDALYEGRWEPFDRQYWREPIRQGRLTRPRAELFLMHWLTMKLAEEVHAHHLYGTFKRVLNQNAEPVVDTITEFARDRDIYAAFFEQPEGSVAREFFDRLEALDTTTAYPIALILFRRDLSEAQRDAGLRMIESWLVRRMICRLTAQGYNRLFVDLVKQLNEQHDQPPEQVIYDFLTSSDADSARWPDDEEVTNVLLDAPLYRTLVRRRLVALLAAIENDLRTEMAEPIDVPSGLTVEHLLPQKWQEHWPLDPDDLEGVQLREAHVHRLGNLTLVTGKLNPSMSNAAWSIKKDALNDHSVLLLNSRVVAANPEVWDEETIDARSRELAGRIMRLWPGPATSTEEWRTETTPAGTVESHGPTP
jgi:hypothetical protein